MVDWGDVIQCVVNIICLLSCIAADLRIVLGIWNHDLRMIGVGVWVLMAKFLVAIVE